MITTLGQYPLLPGLLTEWNAYPVEAAVEDLRPPSFAQEEYLRTLAVYRANGWLGTAWVATAFDLPGDVAPDTLESIFLSFIDRHEALRSGFRLTGDRLRRFTVAPGQVGLRSTVVGAFASGPDIAAYLEARFDEAAGPLENLLPSVFATVTRPDSTTVFVASDHSRSDGYSMFLVPHEIHEIHTAAREGRQRQGLAEVGSHVDFSQNERTHAATIGPDHPGVVVWRNYLDACGGTVPESAPEDEQSAPFQWLYLGLRRLYPTRTRLLPVFPLDWSAPEEEPGDEAAVPDRVLTAAHAEAFDTACKDAGGRFPAGVSAVAAIAAYELSGCPQFHTTTPVHTRTHGRWTSSMGWYINSLPISIDLTDSHDFAGVVSTAVQAVHTAWPAQKVPCSRAWELTGAVPILRNMVSFMDLRGVAGNKQWNDWRVSGLWAKPPPAEYMCVWFFRTHDEVTVRALGPDSETGRRNLARYLTRMAEIMTTVAATGEYAIDHPPAPVARSVMETGRKIG
jgi:condensation domain-containing protein